jgi:hypothetical protein
MDFICLDLKEEVLWEDPILLLTTMKRGLFLREQLIKENYLFAIGQQDLLIRLVAKMIPSLDFGVNKDVFDQLSPSTCSLPTKPSSSLSMTSISAFGKTASM